MTVFKYKNGKLVQVAGNSGGGSSSESSGSSLPVGTIFPSAIPLTDASVHLLDGSTISQTGVYQEFAELLKSLISAGYNISCSQSEFDSAVSSTGNCGKFVIDDTLGTIRLPKITRFIQGLSNMTNIGDSVEAGLPNLTGTAYTVGAGSVGLYSGSSSGVFKAQTSVSGQLQNASGGTTYKELTFDASRSSAVYGKSTTVQPQATSFPYYIVLANGFVSDVKLDIDNIMTEVNNKMPLTGSATRPKYNSKDLALFSDIESKEGTNVYVETYDGTKYYPLAKFTKAVSEGTNSTFVNISGKIGGWGAGTGAYINVLLWGRDARGGSYIFSGDIINALTRQDIVMYEESSTSVVIYLKTVGYTNARLNIKTTASSGGTEILYNASSITTPTGTLIASMSNNKIKASAGQSVVLYDYKSTSSSTNWGKTSGIKGGEKVSGKDFSKYTYLRVTAWSYDASMIYLIDLKNQVPRVLADGYPYVGTEQTTSPHTITEEHYSISAVNTAKTEFYYGNAGYIKGTTDNQRKNNAEYFVMKIEGVF